MKKQNILRGGMYDISLFVFVLLIMGCNSIGTKKENTFKPGYVYFPINPVTVWLEGEKEINRKLSVKEYNNLVLPELVNETVQFTIIQWGIDGSFSVGPVKSIVSKTSYKVVVDYLKYITVSTPPLVLYTEPNYKTYEIKNVGKEKDAEKYNWKVVKRLGAIPLYVGVGVRVKADIFALEGKADMSFNNLVSIATSGKKLSGTINVDSMGISGKPITPLLPIPSEIGTTSVQNAIQQSSAIKTKIYEDDNMVVVDPQIMGFLSPSTDYEIIKSICSFIYKEDFKAYIYEVETLEAKVKTLDIMWIGYDDEDDDNDVRCEKNNEY